MKYLITGGHKLSGEIRVSGNKNSIFPCVAAALLTDDEVVLENVSDIRDTEVLVQILKELGVSVRRQKDVISIEASEIDRGNLPEDLVGKLRGSIVLAGALLGRMGKVHFSHPGGDIIGQRSIETHLEGFEKLGATVKRNDLEFTVKFPDVNTLKNCVIFLQEASVTACENLILASVIGERIVTLKNCPKEPHILDLCKMLVSMGANITGIGCDTLIISGVERLDGAKFRLGTDYIEVGTYIIAASITGGKVKITGLDATDLDPILEPIKRFGIDILFKNGNIQVFGGNLKSIPKIITNVWPGFPTDLMSAAIVLASQAKGATLCHDWMYESRMFFVDKLISMGAHISLADPHRVLVWGPTKLFGRHLATPDIRAGMALVLAALVAKGKSEINQAELIERGYEDVVGKLKRLGATIERSV